MSQLRQREAEIAERELQVLVVTFERPEVARRHLQETGLTWPLLVDQERQLYHAYGLQRAGLWAIWKPSNWPRYLQLLLQKRILPRPTDDVHQLGGNVLIDPHLVVRLHHVSTTPLDRPSVDELLEQVQQDEYR